MKRKTKMFQFHYFGLDARVEAFTCMEAFSKVKKLWIKELKALSSRNNNIDWYIDD